jgi:hypothetical protein
MPKIKVGQVVQVTTDDGRSFGAVIFDDTDIERLTSERLQFGETWESRKTSRTEIAAMIDAAIADYQTALTNWATLTAAQQKAVLRRLVEVDIRVLKMLKSEFVE